MSRHSKLPLFYILQGLRQIQTGMKLQEASTKCCCEGWTCIYLACVGTDTQCLINMLEAMFGDGSEIDPEELDSDAIKKMWDEACKTKEEAAQKEGRPAVANKTIVVSKLPIVPEFGINSNFLLDLADVHEWSKSKGKKVDKMYYQCKVCQHESPNRASVLMHTRKCLRIFLQCKICGKLYQGVKYLEGHIKKRSMRVNLSLRQLALVPLLWQQNKLSFFARSS